MRGKIESPAEAFLVWAGPATLVGGLLLFTVPGHGLGSAAFYGALIVGAVAGLIHGGIIRKRMRASGARQ